MWKKITDKLKRFLQWFTPRAIDIGRLLLEVLTLIIGGAIFIFLAIIGVIYTTVKHLIKRDYSLTRQFRPIVRSLTLSIDGWANASAGEFLNDTQSPKIRFGKWYQTISAVNGINYMNGQDLTMRRIVDGFFEKFGQSQHCTGAVTEEMKCFYLNDKNGNNK